MEDQFEIFGSLINGLHLESRSENEVRKPESQKAKDLCTYNSGIYCFQSLRRGLF